jgi:hypothetical protein
MNVGGKQLDALLESWPAPLPGHDGGSAPKLPARGKAETEQSEERRWDERADATMKAALENTGASHEALEALLAAPALVPEPGESGVMLLSGEKKMAQDNDQGDAPASTTSPPAERKRTSLKEIAARASQSGARSTGAPPPSSSASGTPPPPSIAPLRPFSATPLPRPVEAREQDSGVIDLNVVQATATVQQIAAAEKARPAQKGLFEEEPSHPARAAEALERGGEQPAPVRPVKVAGSGVKKSNTGVITGVAIALVGIAAAFAILHRKPGAPTTQAPVAVGATPQLAPTVPIGATAATPMPMAASAALPAQVPPNPTPGVPDRRPAELPRNAVATAPPVVAGPAAPSKDTPADPRLAATSGPAAAGAPGDLQSEMARAVGPSNGGDKGAQAPPVLEPASGVKNQTIPEQPSQGSVQAAIGAVVGGAKACVAGADDVSRAQVTFSSSGTVSSVSVTGWAATHGKSGCIQAALKGAKVGPFSRSSYVVPVPIRP